MYGEYHKPRGKNPALSCLIRFVSMDRAKQQNYSTIQYKWHFTGPSCHVLLHRKSGALTFINLLVPFADMWDIKLPSPLAIPEYSESSRDEAPSHGAGVVMSNEASNQKAAPLPQLSWRDEVIMLKREVGGGIDHGGLLHNTIAPPMKCE